MNKLLLEDDYCLSNCENLICYHQNIQINIQDTVKLNEYSLDNPSLVLNITNNSNLVFDKINLVNKDTKITLNIDDNATVDLNYLVINEGKNKINITANFKGNNSKCHIKLRVINQTHESNANIICDGIIEENTKDNELIEDLKGLILHDDTIKISPNMLVNTNEVLANHLVTISSFDKEELFYLESKGISAETAKKLLITSFTSIVNKELRKDLEVNYE